MARKKINAPATSAGADELHDEGLGSDANLRSEGQGLAGNAVPLALLGAGLGWLLVHRLTDQGEQAESKRGGRSRDASGRGRKTRSAVDDAMDRSPFAIGAAVFAMGVLGGVALPTSRWEDGVLGERSDALKSSVKERARDFREKAKDAARDTAEALSADARRAGSRLLAGSAMEIARVAMEGGKAPVGTAAATDSDDQPARTSSRERRPRG